MLYYIPIYLLGDFYEKRQEILYCKLPNIKEYRNTIVKNEDDCLQKNLTIFNEISKYFEICVKVFGILREKVCGKKFNKKKYLYLNSLLDICRYNSTGIISYARTLVENYNEYNNFFSHKVEYKHFLNDKIGEVSEKDVVTWEHKKLTRIVHAIDLKKKYNDKSFLENNKGKVNHLKQKSILNSKEIEHMMNNLTKSAREKIISQRIVERFKSKDATYISIDDE